MTTPATYGAIIVTYHTPPATLAACLASLHHNHLTHSIVVDNEPNRNLEPIATQFGATYLPQPTNRGFAAGCHIGTHYLTTDHYLFINPDAILHSHAVATATDYLIHHPRVAIIGLALHDEYGHPEPHSFGPPVTLSSLMHRHVHQSSSRSTPQRVGWVSGGALIIRRPVYHVVGGFDPRFFLYWEDVDLCKRVSDAGWHIVRLPTATATHQRGASLSDQTRKTQFYDESADKYFCKHYSKSVWQLQRLLRHLYRWYSPQVH